MKLSNKKLTIARIKTNEKVKDISGSVSIFHTFERVFNFERLSRRELGSIILNQKTIKSVIKELYNRDLENEIPSNEIKILWKYFETVILKAEEDELFEVSIHYGEIQYDLSYWIDHIKRYDYDLEIYGMARLIRASLKTAYLAEDRRLPFFSLNYPKIYACQTLTADRLAYIVYKYKFCTGEETNDIIMQQMRFAHEILKIWYSSKNKVPLQELDQELECFILKHEEKIIELLALEEKLSYEYEIRPPDNVQVDNLMREIFPFYFNKTK